MKGFMQSEDIQSIRLLDGAFGTNFYPDYNCFREQYVLDHRAEAISLLSAYVRAGADAIYTPTFSANRPMLSQFGAGDQVAFYNRQLAELTIEAADGEAEVGGCISQTGLRLAPEGDCSMDQMIDIFREQAAALRDAGVDFFVIETMQYLGEMRAALLACKQCCDLPVFITVTVDEEGRTAGGSSALCCLAVLQSMGADAFGLNCCAGPDGMADLIRELWRYAKVPLIAKPSAGLLGELSPEVFASYAHALMEAGADMLGGCCGTTPKHLAALRRAMSAARLAGYTRIEQDEDAILAATEFDALLIAPTIDIPEAIPVTEDLAEDILTAEEEQSGALKLRLEHAEDIDTFIENAYMLKDPLCIDAVNPGLFDRFALEYHGRALFDHVGDLDIDEISGIIDQYGIIVL